MQREYIYIDTMKNLSKDQSLNNDEKSAIEALMSLYLKQREVVDFSMERIEELELDLMEYEQEVARIDGEYSTLMTAKEELMAEVEKLREENRELKDNNQYYLDQYNAMVDEIDGNQELLPNEFVDKFRATIRDSRVSMMFRSKEQ